MDLCLAPMTKEISIQFACKLLLQELSDIYLFRHFHVANEGKSAGQYQMKLKKMAFRAGVPDFIIEYPPGKLLYVELKNEKGQLSNSQKLWKVQSVALNTPFFVVKGNIEQCLIDLTEIIDKNVPRRPSKKY